MYCILLAGMLLGAAPGDSGDARAALVSKLGAPRYNDREAAARAIQAQGAEVLPQLRAAVKTTTDPELRSRAADLIARIENAAMLEPTRVRFSYPGTPLTEILKDLSAQSHIPVALDWRDAPTNSAADSLHLHVGEPIAFWDAVERVATAAQLRVNFGPDQGMDNRGYGLGVRLSQTPSRNRAPISLSGPFRFKIDSIHHQRDRHFDQDVDDASDEQLYLAVQIMSEPRLSIRQRGTIRIREAIDELGQSLSPPAIADEDDVALFAPFEVDATPRIDLQVFLKRPERSGATIKTLRGTVPLNVVSRKQDPLEIPLEGAEGKTFAGDAIRVTVRSISRDPIEPQTTILLGIRRRLAEGGELAEGDDEAGASSALTSQFDARDSKGRRLLTFAGDLVPDGAGGVDDETISLSIASPDDTGVPTHLQVYGLNHANVDVPFEFHDVPMP
jgi:hypothetical protein